MNGLAEVLKVLGAGGWGPAVVVLLVMLWAQAQQFAAMEQRFDERFDAIDQRLDTIERRQERIEALGIRTAQEVARLHGLIVGLHPELGSSELKSADARTP